MSNLTNPCSMCVASVGKVEALGPDNEPLNPPLGTVVNFTVSYWRPRTESDEYTTRYYWQWPPTSIRETLLSKAVAMDKDGVAVLKIPSVPDSATSVTIEARVSVMSKRLDN